MLCIKSRLFLFVLFQIVSKFIFCEDFSLKNFNRSENFKFGHNRILLDLRSDVKYLIFQPQFGICNQLRALHQAIAIAKVLCRVLVIPDIIDNDGKGPILKRDLLFDSDTLISALDTSSYGAVNTESFLKFIKSNEQFVPVKFLDLKLTSFKQLVPSNLYFDSIKWHFPVVYAELKGYIERNWREWDSLDQENVRKVNTLAVTMTYGAWLGAEAYEMKVWHSRIEELVYKESAWISDLVRDITNSKLLKVNKKLTFLCCLFLFYFLFYFFYE